MTVEGCGSESLQGDVRFAEVMGLMGAQVQWQPYSITITGACHPAAPIHASLSSMPATQDRTTWDRSQVPVTAKL